ncbi:MAG: gliding motility protein GldL [Porphyromonadaceae bacterium]|nr:gliding motility protein GldL [Porphyromonadaceae bacterium]
MSEETKHRKYKNIVELFLASRKGKRVLNILYSWGAAVVILGALFKLLHLPYGNLMLFVGMMTEFLVFFVSGFEKPASEYHWENVFPQLDSDNPMDKEEIEARRKYLQEKAKEAAERVARGEDPFEDPSMAEVMPYAQPYLSKTPLTPQPVEVAGNEMEAAEEETMEYTASPQAQATNINSENVTRQAHSIASLVGEEELQKLHDGINKLTESIEQLARIGQMADRMAQTYEEMQNISDASQNYKEQIESLGKNIAGLNTIYEIQLKGISSQIDTIDHINNGLHHIKNMYDGTVLDSTAFNQQNALMASQLKQINEVYARLLKALTSNMGMPPMPNQWTAPNNEAPKPENAYDAAMNNPMAGKTNQPGNN